MQRGENKVAGERSLNGDLRRLKVARLADKNAVGVLAKEGAEATGEVETDAFVDRDLDDAVDVVFDRVLGREQFCVRFVDLAQAGVKRGRFTRSGGAGDDDDTVGQLDHVPQGLLHVVRHPELVEIKLDGRTVENTEHDAFAELGRQRADPQIDGEGFSVARDAALDTAVLRKAAFGDVEV